LGTWQGIFRKICKRSNQFIGGPETSSERKNHGKTEMKKILVDSGPLIALFDASDKHHARAINFIKNNNSILISTIASITETLHL
jgi:hypothetical protein